MRKPETEGAAIVMIGSFNPAIFQPRWLSTQGLIRREEGENARITVVQEEVADFSTEWFQLQVLQKRLTLTSADPRHYGPLRDLAVGMFGLLPHTPVTLIGLSRRLHYQMPSVDAWHAIGHILAPKTPWNGIMNAPGLRSILMQGRRPEQNGSGVLYIKVEPSLTIKHGVFVEINEEFRLPADEEVPGAEWAGKHLAQQWDGIMDFAEEAADRLLGLTQ